jgi:hypothetical protein
MATKSILRSVRLDPAMYELLKRDAEARGISVNALMSHIFLRYAEWDRLADRFPMISISRQGFRDLIGRLSEQELKASASEAGTKNAPEITLFWYKRLNLQTFLKFVVALSRFGKTFEYELDVHGREYCITLHHEINHQYSEFLRGYFDSAVRTIVGVAPKIEIGKTSVVIRFIEPTP